MYYPLTKASYLYLQNKLQLDISTYFYADEADKIPSGCMLEFVDIELLGIIYDVNRITRAALLHDYNYNERILARLEHLKTLGLIRIDEANNFMISEPEFAFKFVILDKVQPALQPATSTKRKYDECSKKESDFKLEIMHQMLVCMHTMARLQDDDIDQASVRYKKS
jgi:hypothetical protein